MILDEIIANKQQEVAALKAHLNIAQTTKLIKGLPAPRPFLGKKFALIAELKKASPSAGVLREKYEPIYLAKQYEEAGASALSVLTDAQYFQGKLADLQAAKESTVIPVLRKDFIIDAAQLYESRVAGADAVLLIARILSDQQLGEFLAVAQELKLKCLVETHNAAEVERVLKTNAGIIGINNRDLDTLAVDSETTVRLIDKYPELKKRTVVAESGISTGEQVRRLKQHGVSAILVGEGLLRSSDIAAKIRELLS
jgi:indole-3-glycerol phosphate synthase